MNGLSHGQVIKVVNRYVGVEEGYLGTFSYRTHADFYPEYCDLEYDPSHLEGTTRERFIQILRSAPAADQAAILRGVVAKFPVGDPLAPRTRTSALRDELLQWATALEKAPPVASPDLKTRSAAVERALADAEALIAATGAPSAVDRVHTALHAYLQALCDEAAISTAQDADLTSLLKCLRTSHPDLQPVGPRADDITKILRSTAAIVDALNPVRNRASGAHPNPQVLESPEAMLVVNLVRSLLHFMNMRIGSIPTQSDEQGT